MKIFVALVNGRTYHMVSTRMGGFVNRQAVWTTQYGRVRKRYERNGGGGFRDESVGTSRTCAVSTSSTVTRRHLDGCDSGFASHPLASAQDDEAGHFRLAQFVLRRADLAN